MKNTDSIPKELENELNRTNEIVLSFLMWIDFCIRDTARDPEFTNNHLLTFLSQDVLETLMGVLVQVKEGIHTPAIRESRYLLELSVKLAYIQQKNYAETIDKKLNIFNKIIKSPSISSMREIDLTLLSPVSVDAFLEEVGRLYGESSKFVHLTPHAIEYRRRRLDKNRILGNESKEDLSNLNDFLQKIYAAAIIFISHAVPQYVIGDWYVDSSGDLTKWYYIKSKYVAEIDSTLDYKHERKHILEKVQLERVANITF